MSANERKKNVFNAKYIAKVGVFAALAYVLYLVPKFPLPVFFPSWLEFNFSDIPALIGTFALGPLGGTLIVLVKILLKLPFSQTGCSGEFSDLLCGLALVIPAGLIYKRHRSFRGALIAMAIGTLCTTVVSVFGNRFIAVPWFVNAYFGGDFSGIVKMLSPLFPNVTEESFYRYYLFLSVVPFNLLRCLVVCIVTALTYKHISRLLAKF